MCKVSIIMCVFNTPIPMLEKAVDSILEQSFADFEFIIYNDGSNNSNIKDYFNNKCKIDSRIKYYEDSVNHGLAYGLNVCLKYSNGEYIARMDSDDYCEKNRLEKQLKYLIDNNLDVVGCDMYYFDDEGVWGQVCYNKLINNRDFLFNSPMSHPTIIAKKETFENVGGYCEDSYCLRNEDYDLFMRMQSKSFKLGNINEKLYYFREDSESSARRKFKYRINEYKVRKKGFKLLKLYPRGILYLYKPIIIGMMPKWLYKKLKRKKGMK